MADRRPQTKSDRAEQGSPPEPGDAVDQAQNASLDPDEQGDVGGDQDIDTAGTDADQQVSLKERERMTKQGK